ncbi:hypothetical protein MKW92_007275 [Papaver armeniacum]|nr:hypothetical protein MKW92_007275 [Papaver armeniacum]
MKKNKTRTTEMKRRCISVHNDLDDDVVVCHMLSRLPVKSLMRFKCVCKRWKLIMEEDSHFISLHLSHSETRPSLFILLQESPVGELTRYYETFILGPIGGLICFAGIFGVRIYNVSTREVTPAWINSTVYMNVEKKKNGIEDASERPPGCYFGFDPITKMHKVIFVWCSGKFQKDPVCEVLIVGDNTWKVIDELPPASPIAKACVSANGSIYCDEEEEWLMAFDIGSHKFRMIPVPKSESFTIIRRMGFLLPVVKKIGLD